MGNKKRKLNQEVDVEDITILNRRLLAESDIQRTVDSWFASYKQSARSDLGSTKTGVKSTSQPSSTTATQAETKLSFLETLQKSKREQEIKDEEENDDDDLLLNEFAEFENLETAGLGLEPLKQRQQSSDGISSQFTAYGGVHARQNLSSNDKLRRTLLVGSAGKHGNPRMAVDGSVGSKPRPVDGRSSLTTTTVTKMTNGNRKGGSKRMNGEADDDDDEDDEESRAGQIGKREKKNVVSKKDGNMKPHIGDGDDNDDDGGKDGLVSGMTTTTAATTTTTTTTKNDFSTKKKKKKSQTTSYLDEMLAKRQNKKNKK